MHKSIAKEDKIKSDQFMLAERLISKRDEVITSEMLIIKVDIIL
jgi:hypothetical protein